MTELASVLAPQLMQFKRLTNETAPAVPADGFQKFTASRAPSRSFLSETSQTNGADGRIRNRAFPIMN